MRALSELKMGEQATIVGYNFTKPAVLQQLLEMGMTKGTVVLLKARHAIAVLSAWGFLLCQCL